MLPYVLAQPLGLPNFQEPHPSPMFYTPLGDPDHGSVNITVK